MRKNWIDTLAKVMERIVPDAITTSIILFVLLFITSIALSNSQGGSFGGSVSMTMDAYYKGLWMMLAFTMQMTLILVLSLVLGSTPVFRNLIIRLSKIPRNSFQFVALAVICAACVAYTNWGLSYALAPLIAIHVCKEAESKGIQVDFLFLLATLAGALAPGEIVDLNLFSDGRQVIVETDLPVALLGNGDPFEAVGPGAPRAVSAGMFGNAFTLRLARAEAEAAGGRLERRGDALRLVLPVREAMAAVQR